MSLDRKNRINNAIKVVKEVLEKNKEKNQNLNEQYKRIIQLEKERQIKYYW